MSYHNLTPMSCGAAGAALCCDGGESQGLVIALEAAQLESWIALATAHTHHQHFRHGSGAQMSLEATEASTACGPGMQR